ncbi:hypothetical protein B0H34DRAFT_733559 [Crassisporium funariophilum]|nr:hypothetical protein B0H34DRAFT_733559 [Crassisporium funariophilum]
MILPAVSSVSNDAALPFELERKIFEIAAQNDLGCAVRLISVARRVREWIEPTLYRIMIVESDVGSCRYPPVERPTDGPLDSIHLERYTSHCRHALLQRMDIQRTEEILKHCKSVTDLALWSIEGNEWSPTQSFIDILASLPLERLYMDMEAVITYLKRTQHNIDVFLGNTFLSNLTHLSVISTNESFWDDWAWLKLLPRLKYLALDNHPYDIAESTINGILGCLNIELLILFTPDDNLYWHIGHLMYTSVKDIRFVVMLSINRNQSTPDWESGARGGDNFWGKNT